MGGYRFHNKYVERWVRTDTAARDDAADLHTQWQIVWATPAAAHVNSNMSFLPYLGKWLQNGTRSLDCKWQHRAGVSALRSTRPKKYIFSSLPHGASQAPGATCRSDSPGFAIPPTPVRSSWGTAKLQQHLSRPFSNRNKTENGISLHTWGRELVNKDLCLKIHFLGLLEGAFFSLQFF